MRNTYLLVFIIFISFYNANAQQLVPARVLENFTLLKSYAPNEHIYIVTDRDKYVPGDMMWFNVFNLNGDSLSGLSKVGYVEMLDNNQQPVLQAKINLDHGKGRGSFVIPENLKTAYYTLRGYTSWMKNYSTEFYFQKNILINNVFNNESISADTKTDPLINFYPEGNNMVFNLPATIAIAAADSAGIPIPFSGILTNSKSDTLANFNGDENGMSTLNFTPATGENYTAIFTFQDGKKFTRALPDILSTGSVLHVHDTANNTVVITINASANTDVKYIIIHDRDSIKFSQRLQLVNGQSNILIDKARLSNGLNHIILLDADGKLINERSYAVYKNEPGISVSTDKDSYSKREKILLNINEKNDTADRPLNVSVSVYRNDFVDLKNKNLDDIINNDLQGNDYSANTPDVLNNRLIATIWNAFNWNNPDVLKPAPSKFLPEYEGHIVSAIITDAKTKLPLANTIGYLSVPGKAFQFYTSRSNQAGLINFFTKDLYGDNLVIAQADRTDDGPSEINILSPFSQDAVTNNTRFYSTIKPDSIHVEEAINVQLQKDFAYNKIVTNQAKVDSMPFFGKEDMKYDLDDYVRFPTMEEVLREYVRELNVRKKKDEFALSMVTKSVNNIAVVRNPAILIDGVPAFDTGNKISHYDPLKIKTIRIVTDRYYYGPAVFDGIASFTTYKGNLEGYTPDPNSTVIDYSGLQLNKNFYSPVYQTPEQKSSRLPDFRDLLYWNNNISLSSEGKGEAEIYTSDQTGKYIIVVTTLTKSGRFIQSTKTITVQ